MKAVPLAISDIFLFKPRVFEDDRGFFFESFHQKLFEEKTGLSKVFVQDNHSKSSKGALRGLHYQLPPRAQGKLVRVTQGEVFDVAVDIRKSSPTFGQWIGRVISAKNMKQIWIPEGFAHGFLTLSKTAEFLYKTDSYYAPEYEHCIAWNDPAIGIDWPINKNPLLSDEDKQGKLLSNSQVFP